MTDTLACARVNGIDLVALDEQVEAVKDDAARGSAGFRVKTRWTGQTRSETSIEAYSCGGERIERNFIITADEPRELLGTDSAPNPQELLMAALNACMMVGYVAQAAVRGINLRDVQIETEGELDLRGFLGIDAVPPGYRRINFTVHLDGDGTPEQFEEIHEAVVRTSPNYFNLAQPIQMCGRLV